MVDANEKAEFLGQIIDVFEDFLTERGVEQFNNEPQEDNDPDSQVYIYGNDYYEIEDALEEIMERWNVIK